MKTKAKIKFCRFENALAMQVLYMDERFRVKSMDYPDAVVFRSQKNNISIVSKNYPAINYNPEPNNVYWVGLHGKNNGLDSKSIVANYIFNDEFLNMIIEALKDWAQNWEGWKDEPAIKPKIMDDFGNEIDLETYTGSVVVVEV